MSESIDRFWDDEEEPKADGPHVDELEALDEDEQSGDAILDPPSGVN
jgi:hypothetical protein